MDKFKVVLAAQDGVPVVEAHSISINFQPSFTDSNDSLSEGNINIAGKQTLQLANGQSLEANLKPINVRLSELEALLFNMAEGEEKVTAQAKFDNWSNCLTNIQFAIAQALEAQYLLDNPQVA